jgi:hypothetical protein
MISKIEYDSKVVSHMRQDKTMEIIKGNYFWPGMHKYIEDIICSYESYQCSKAPKHTCYGLLCPLELAYAQYQSIFIDFIVDHHKSNRYIQIWVIVNHFIKMGHRIPLKNEGKWLKDLTKIYVSNIWSLPRFPTDIVSDRDRRFHALWAKVCNLFNIGRRISMAYHPETDRYTERVNQTLEQYLHLFCNVEQDKWSEMLPLAEYANNNSLTSVQAMAPLYANYRYHSRTNWHTEGEA